MKLPLSISVKWNVTPPWRRAGGVSVTDFEELKKQVNRIERKVYRDAQTPDDQVTLPPEVEAVVQGHQDNPAASGFWG